MDCRHSEVSVPLYPRWGLYTVESINGVTTISLHHKPILSSTMETDGIERPDMNSSCVSAAPARSAVSRQHEPSSDSKGGCSFCQRTEQNVEELLNFERELVRRGFHLTEQYPQQISKQGVAFTETHNQVFCKSLLDALRQELVYQIFNASSRIQEVLRYQNDPIMGSLSSRPTSTQPPAPRKVCMFSQRPVIKMNKALQRKRKSKANVFHWLQSYSITLIEKQLEVLQPKSAKRSNQILQPESSKKLKQDNLKSPDSQLTGSSGWCSLCQIDCKGKKVLEGHILGRRHRQTLKKLKEGEIIGIPEENEKQANEGDVPQKKHKRSLNTNEQTVKCHACDKVFITQDSFDLHFAGKKHAKKLKIMESFKVSSRVEDDSKKCATADENKLISTDSGLLAEDDGKKIAECKHAGKAKDDGNLSGRSDKFDVKANTVLKDQQKKKKEGMPYNKQKKSKELRSYSKKACKTCNVVVFSELDFEEHLSGRKHARMLKILEVYKSFLEREGNGKEHGKVNSKESGGSDLGLLSNNNADKMIEDKTISELKDDGNLRANSDKDLQRDDCDNIDVSDGEDNKLEVEARNDNDVQKEIAEIKEIDGEDLQRDDGDNVDLSDGEDSKLEVEVRNDIDDQKEIAEIKEIDGEDIDVPNGEDNNLDVEVRDDKEITKTDYFDGEKYNKMDIKEVAISDLKRSEASCNGSSVKDDVCKISEDRIILEVKGNGGLEAHGVKDGL